MRRNSSVGRVRISLIAPAADIPATHGRLRDCDAARLSAPRLPRFPPANRCQGAYNALVGAGVTFFDTSDVYGYKSAEGSLSAEHLLGRFAEENPTVRACVRAFVRA